MRTRLAGAVAGFMVAFACTGGSTPEPPTPPSEVIRAGGTFRGQIEDFGFDGGFDPTAEGSRLGMALQSQLLLRTLVTYRHVAGPQGTEPVPDLATITGEISEDGLTWTFTLKEGIRFGPPLNRPVTSADVEFAFRRIATAGLEAGYGYLYLGLIEGTDSPTDRMPLHISGIDTPDPRTIVFHLTRPVGDFLHRLAMPATAPMPAEVAGCFDRPGDYGRDLVSTGPYMIEGAGGIDASSCRNLEPMPGFNPVEYLRLERNPAYVPSTDDPAVRESLPDRIEISINTNSDDILNQVEQGNVDATFGVAGAPQGLEGRHRLIAHRQPLNDLEYLSMNVLVAPFDDVHVRRAVHLVLNRRAMARAFGLDSRVGGDTHLSAVPKSRATTGTRTVSVMPTHAGRFCTSAQRCHPR